MSACIPQSAVYHVGGVTPKRENPHKTFLNFRNNPVMLYKNLSEEKLGYAIHVRAVLDCVATLNLLSRGQFTNMWAVLRTRRAFHPLRPLFAVDREENLKKTSLPVIPEQMKSSILIQSYSHGKKFSPRS